VKRKFRLTRSTDFKRVRRFGKSHAHPLIVLVALPNENEPTRFGIAAGRTVGGAVQRNRAKRMVREALRPLISQVQPGWDILLLCRQPILAAMLPDIQAALTKLLQRASLFKVVDGYGSSLGKTDTT
jgi:ribonuclease P protein component